VSVVLVVAAVPVAFLDVSGRRCVMLPALGWFALYSLFFPRFFRQPNN
jgi:hypothetical protein